MADTDTLTPPVTKPDAKPPVKEAPKPDSTPIDYDRVGQALGLGGMQKTLQEDRAKIDAMAPGPPKLVPPPVTPPPSDPFQAFGQPAMWLATFGSLLTRHHLTSAIQSAGTVLDSVHKQDDAAVQRAMAEWKVNSENAVKMAKYEQDAYKAAITKYATDARAGEAEMVTLNHAFQNVAAAEVLRTEGPAGLIRMFGKHGTDVSTLEKRKLDLQAEMQTQADKLDARKAWDGGHPEATPGERSAAHMAIDKGLDPNAEKGGAAGKAESDVDTIATVNRKRSRGEDVTPEEKTKYDDAVERQNVRRGVKADTAAATSGARTPLTGTPAAVQKNVEDDLKSLHKDDPAWTPGRISAEARSQIAAGNARAITQARLKAQMDDPPFTPEQAHTLAMFSLVSGQQMVSARLGAAALRQVLSEEANIVKNSGHTVEEYLTGQAAFKADAASLRALTVRTDALDAAAKATRDEFKNVVIPAIPNTPEPLDMQVLTQWARTGETQFGDTEVPVYMATLISGLDEYAKVLAGATGAAGSTDASRAQAISIIKEGATTAQIKSIIYKAILPTIDVKINDYQKQKEVIETRMANAGPAGGHTEPRQAERPKPAGMTDDQIITWARKGMADHPDQKSSILNQLRAWGINAGGL